MAGSQSGRAATLSVLDKMMGTEANKAKLAAALEEYFEADPVRFFKTVIMPCYHPKLSTKFSPNPDALPGLR